MSGTLQDLEFTGSTESGGGDPESNGGDAQETFAWELGGKSPFMIF